MTETKLTADKTLTRIWRALPAQFSSVVGEEAKLAEPTLARAWVPTGKRYYAELELAAPRSGKLLMCFALPLAIASAGHLMLRPKGAIASNIESGTFEGDDLDAMGECVNTFCAALNEAVQAELGEDHRFVFHAGSLEPPDPSTLGPLSVASGHLQFGELAAGDLELVVPDAVFVAVHERPSDDDDDDDGDDDGDDDDDAGDDGAYDDVITDKSGAPGDPAKSNKKKRRRKPKRGSDVASAASPDDAEGHTPADSDSQNGPLLSSEELSAIRDAMQVLGKGVAVVVTQRSATHETWRATLVEVGVEFEFVANQYQLLTACRERSIDTIVVDADGCASGGLSVLAAIRGGVGVPERRIVVASRPTRPHIVACLAGGASDYLCQPLDLDELRRVLDTAR